MKTLFYNARLIDAQTDAVGAILVDDGIIDKIWKNQDCDVAYESYKDDESVQKIDVQTHVLMPSFIELHAHFRDPGLTHKEDIQSGSQAAVAGGYGSVVLMANTSPPVSDIQTVRQNAQKARNIGLIDIFQTVSITQGFDGDTISHLQTLNAEEVPMVSEDGFDVASSCVLFDAMKICAEKGIVVSCHSEDMSFAHEAKKMRYTNAEGKKHAEHLLYIAENIATARNIELAEEAQCRIHLAHVSTKKSMNHVRRAKKAGVHVTCEVTPHHIALTASAQQTVNPPLQSEKDRLALIEAIADGTVDAVATDHAPHTPEDKQNGAPGFTALETAFAVCNTILVKQNNINLCRLSGLMSQNPADILGLRRHGLLKKGFVADFVIIDTEKQWNVASKNFFSKGKNTPFEGMTVYGKPIKTVKNGKTVFDLNYI